MMTDLISRAAARDVINTWGRKENEDVHMDLLHNDLNSLMNTHIQSDTAKKLGLKPKEGV